MDKWVIRTPSTSSANKRTNTDAAALTESNSRTIGRMSKGAELTRNGFRAKNWSLDLPGSSVIVFVILSYDQAKRTTPERIPPSPNFHTTSTGVL
ncbi:hypothetical protein TNCV_2069771 [Trichonephila clavipes]|uniref:Uncharacterized protein n=1 Tax=Trichonephila clavipes TaxID=2585209 RepID=A0A8X6W3G9_TRICX|nr:hypothetical protein TNCV_2069771 [Trichonephila clavipes]